MSDAVETPPAATCTSSVTILRIAIVALAIVIVDQYTKLLVVAQIPRGAAIPVIPGFFDLTLTYNMGAAFGLFSGLPESFRIYVLLAAAMVAFSVVVYYMRSPHGQTGLARFAFALIIGGAIGNLIDRLRLGMVVDFLDVYFGTYHWPAFNIADSCICIGVVLLVLAPAPRPHAEK